MLIKISETLEASTIYFTRRSFDRTGQDDPRPAYCPNLSGCLIALRWASLVPAEIQLVSIPISDDDVHIVNLLFWAKTTFV